MTRHLVRLDKVTPDMDLEAFSRAWSESGRATIHAAAVEAHRCPVCRTPLPDDVHHRRVYCDNDCRRAWYRSVASQAGLATLGFIDATRLELITGAPTANVWAPCP